MGSLSSTRQLLKQCVHFSFQFGAKFLSCRYALFCRHFFDILVFLGIIGFLFSSKRFLDLLFQLIVFFALFYCLGARMGFVVVDKS